MHVIDTQTTTGIGDLLRHAATCDMCPSEPGARIAKRVRRKRATFPKITNIELILTNDCCCACDYCWTSRGDRRAMTRDVARDALDFQMAASGSQKQLRILFFGGEPLLEFDLLRFVVETGSEMARSAGKSIGFDMTTNGIPLDEEMLGFLSEHGIKLLLSIDGTRSVHDKHRPMRDGSASYDQIMGKIPLLKAYQPWLGTRLTVHTDTIGRLSDGVRHLHQRGINQFLIGLGACRRNH